MRSTGAQPKRLRDVFDILEYGDFKRWYSRFIDCKKALKETRADLETLQERDKLTQYKADLAHQRADDAVFEAGEWEEEASGALAEYTEIENESFEALAQFELQRQKTSEYWIKAGAAEQHLEESRRTASELRREVAVARSRLEQDKLDHLESELNAAEEAVERAFKAVQASQREYDESEVLRDEMWRQVETRWGQSFSAAMVRSEYTFKARRQRSKAQKLFGQAADARRDSEVIRDNLTDVEQTYQQREESLHALLIEARTLFQCAILDEFMFWPAREDMEISYCVPLLGDTENLDMPLEALKAYRTSRARGLEDIRLVEGDGKEDDDPRLAAFFAPPVAPDTVEGRE